MRTRQAANPSIFSKDKLGRYMGTYVGDFGDE